MKNIVAGFRQTLNNLKRLLCGKVLSGIKNNYLGGIIDCWTLESCYYAML